MRRLLALPLALVLTPNAQARPEARLADLGAVLDRAVSGMSDTMTRIAGAVHGLDISDRLIQVRVQLRDAVRSAETWLVGLAGPLSPESLDLTPLVSSPVPEVSSSGFGWRADPMNGRRTYHMGTDFRADRGTPVLAAGDGMVVLADWYHGYGRTVIIDHGGGVLTRYAHLAKIGVRRGDAVTAENQIGRVGSSGRATGPHLHFEVRLDGRPVDPVLAMQIAELARTTPELAKVAAMALAPEVQDRALDEEDPRNWRRRPSGRRSDALW